MVSLSFYRLFHQGLPLHYHTPVPNIPVSFLFVLVFPYRPCDLLLVSLRSSEALHSERASSTISVRGVQRSVPQPQVQAEVHVVKCQQWNVCGSGTHSKGLLYVYGYSKLSLALANSVATLSSPPQAQPTADRSLLSSDSTGHQ
jgi:hypothetical protein